MFTLKRNLFLIAVLLIVTLSAWAQNWIQLNSGVTQHLKSVSFTDPMTGWVCGYGGTILYTNSGGASWIAQNSGVNVQLMGISFCNATTGTAAGNNGDILKTTDGGNTWQTAQSGWMVTYYTAEQIDALTAFVGGVNTIFQSFGSKTVNGWQSLTNFNFYVYQGGVGNEGQIKDFAFITPTHGFAAIQVWDGEGAIVETVDGGSTWQTIFWNDFALYAIDFPTAEVGFAAGLNGSIARTTDGGRNWQNLTSPTANTLLSASFIDANTGWMVGQNGTIIHTANGGVSWTMQTSPTNNHLNGVCFADAQTGYAVADDGVIIKFGEVVPPNVSVTLTPAVTPVVVPASGGSFDFNIAVANNSNFIANVDVWTTAVSPLFIVYGPFINANITMPGGYTGDRGRTQFVPAAAMAGAYTYKAYIGDYPNLPLDSSSFTFFKEPGDGFVNGNDNWSCSGDWDEPDISPFIVYRSSITVSTSPNPFNPDTRIAFDLPVTAWLNLTVYDLQGRIVTVLAEGLYSPGNYKYIFNGKDLASGIYFYRLNAGNFTAAGKLLLVK